MNINLSENVNFSRLLLYQQLFLYGDFIPLKFKIDVNQLASELNFFDSNWIPYNISKGDRGRFGLSLTSLDGEMSGYPDLGSLYEHAKITGKRVSENDFNKWTLAVHKCLSLHEVFNYFGNSVGRSRLVKFNSGGHFPPHRDQSVKFQVPDYFRLFCPLANTGEDGLIFLYDDKKINFEVGRIYLFNALKTHSVFSFRNDTLTLAMSLKLDQHSIEKALHSLHTN